MAKLFKGGLKSLHVLKGIEFGQINPYTLFLFNLTL
jgi:hypothetical protein